MKNMFIENLEDRNIDWLNNFCKEIVYTNEHIVISDIHITYDSIIKISKQMLLYRIKWDESKHAYKNNHPWLEDIHGLLWIYVRKGIKR